MSDTSLVFNILAKDQASKVFGKIKGSALIAGAAIGTALAGGVASTIEKSKLDATLAAQIGAGPAEAARIGKLSGAVFANNFGEDLPSVNAAMKAAFQNGLANVKTMTDSTVQQVTERLLTVGTVLQEDSERVSAAVSQMLRTGMARSSQEAMDLLVKATQNGVNKSQDLLDTVNEYGTQFRKLGLNGPQAMGLLSQAIKAGARDSDTAADALKEFAIRAIDGSKLTAQSFKALGLDAKTMTSSIARGGDYANEALGVTLDKLKGVKDPALQAQIAVGLFGTKAEDLGKSLFAMDVDTAAGQMKGMAGATDAAATTMSQSAGAKVDAFKRKIQGGLVGALGSAVGWIEKNQTTAKNLAVVLGSLAGAVLAVSVGMKVYAAAQAVIRTATMLWTGVQWLLNTAFLASPVTWIVLAIIALIAVIVLIATKTTWFQTIWKVVWGGIKAAASAVGSWFVDTLWKKWIVGAWNGITGAATKAWNWMKALPGKMKAAFLKVNGYITAPFRAAFNAVGGLWNRTVGRLHFSVPSWVPGLGGKGFSMPQIPKLAAGGIVRARAGGTLALLGEGGQDEAVVPLSRGGGRVGGEQVIRVIVEGTGLLSGLKNEVRARGGNVQVVLGGSRG